ncbi:MAG: hypothetical protein KA748_03355 [Halomonas sp.]|nr:SGNH/GDSL hydrolase family protein [Halomonas sp.]MBP5979221.1 hypothetical protein [Halomonas sp.]
MRNPVKLAVLLCTLPVAAQAATVLEGSAIAEKPFADAKVTIIDSTGKQLDTMTDSTGHYRINIDSLSPPLTLSVMDNGESADCLNSDIRRARCMASLLVDVQDDAINTANITPFSDRIVAEVAGELGYVGPQQWVERGDPRELNAQLLDEPLANFQQGMAEALNELSMPVDIDPVRTPIQAGDGMTQLLSVVNHNRGYHNDSGEAGSTILTDSAFRPIVGLQNHGPWEPFDLQRALRDKEAITEAQTRILIVSDSTAATYEVSRLPRMGWGQVFHEQFQPESGVVILNGARAGRSSRDFYNEGWYQQMAQYLEPGDYVLIAHGHNDQNCNSEKPVRGAADVRNLCTYPNDAEGNPQYPEGRPEMSFQHSLERYITLARDNDAMPVLLTPTTRVKNEAGKTAFVNGPDDRVVSSHFTRDREGYLFSGDYVATIKQTASDNQVPLIDLEDETIAFANAHADDWMDYWLAVDAEDPRYPWYHTQTAGIRTNPDTTHFQRRGAEAVASIVAEQIQQTPELSALAARLKP